MRLFLPLLACALAACSTGPASDDVNDATINVDAIDSAADRNVAEPPAPGTPGGLANDGTPLSEAPIAPDSAQGAAQVVQRYFALIEEKKFGEARVLWEEGAEGAAADVSAFAARFAKYPDYHANIGAPGEIDAGAGQRYVTVPVVIYGRSETGMPFNRAQKVTLHRTADIDGATAQQKSWHIRSID